MRDRVAKAGIFSISSMNNWPTIKRKAEEELRRQLAGSGHTGFIRYRDRLVNAGIGTVEEWNKLL